MAWDPQGWWFKSQCGHDEICTDVGLLSKALNPTLGLKTPGQIYDPGGRGRGAGGSEGHVCVTRCSFFLPRPARRPPFPPGEGRRDDPGVVASFGQRIESYASDQGFKSHLFWIRIHLTKLVRCVGTNSLIPDLSSLQTQMHQAKLMEHRKVVESKTSSRMRTCV